MRGGNVYVIADGKELRVEAETQIAEGMTVDRAGLVTMKDGRKIELKNGQMVSADGKVSDAARK